MIRDIEDGKIDVVLVKDQSRLGREHLRIGYPIWGMCAAGRVGTGPLQDMP